MRRFSPLLVLLFATLTALAQPAPSGAPVEVHPERVENGIAWYDATQIGIEGQGWKGADLATPYDRLPARAEALVRGPVWRLSENSANLAVHFVTDSKALSARWSLRKEERAMNHMPATGVSGLDLYARDGDRWRWVATGIPEKVDNESKLVTSAPEGAHEYLLYLPLYNGVNSVQIGIDEGAALAKAPARKLQKPVLFYGTSITQGGCAARSGMAYTGLIGRALDIEAINLGFSGNALMDEELIALFAEVDAAVYVLNPLPNMKEDLVKERYVNFVTRLRGLRPDTPILLVGNIQPQGVWFISSGDAIMASRTSAADQAWEQLKAANVPGLFFVPGAGLLGDDGLGTVDGIHPTDVGFMRMAEAIAPVLKQALESRP